MWRFTDVGRFFAAIAVAIAATLLASPAAYADHDIHKKGDALKGAKVFRVCVVCHVLEPGEHRTGPSLAGLWGRTSGTAKGYTRYSPAIVEAGITWDEHSLDAWIAAPNRFIPGTRMPFAGIPDEKARTDLIAFLSLATSHTKEKAAADSKAANNPATNSEKVLASRARPPKIANLKTAGPPNFVVKLQLCRDNYTVVTGSGIELTFWEYNLRLKTDSSERGPPPGLPVIIPSGIEGDRAMIVFSDPAEISRHIKKQC